MIERLTHINVPKYSDIEISKRKCFDRRCNKQRWHVYGYQEWYGSTRCSLFCGRGSTMADDGILHDSLSPGRGVANKERKDNITYWKNIYRKQ